MDTKRKRKRALEAMGWSVEHTGGSHLICRHPEVDGPLFLASTPSDWRSNRTVVAQLRRALRTGRAGR